MSKYIIALFSFVGIMACSAQDKQIFIKLDNEKFQHKLDSLGNELQLIDVRTKEEYESGHIENARNLDIRDSSFLKALPALKKDVPILLYCQKGGRSSRAAEICVEHGFRFIYELKDGYAQFP